MRLMPCPPRYSVSTQKWTFEKHSRYMTPCKVTVWGCRMTGVTLHGVVSPKGHDNEKHAE
jgi:hypothetical protein